MRDGPPSLAADAAVVVGPHLHLHEWDGKLMAFPMVPVDTLNKNTEWISEDQNAH